MKTEVVVIFDPAYYTSKEQHINTNFNVTHFIAFEEKLVGTMFMKKEAQSLSILSENPNRKVVIAIPWSDALSRLVKQLIDIGISKDNIIFLFNKPNHFDFQESIGFTREGTIPIEYKILDTGDIVCETANKSLLVSNCNERFIVAEIFEDNCYNFTAPAPTVVVDIGMNIGTASIFFATKEGVEKVYGYEPFPATYERAVQNIALNGISTDILVPNNVGVGGTNKKLTISYNPELKGLMSTSVDRFTDKGLKKASVQIVDIAKVFKTIIGNHPSATFVFKVDCEGGEYEIFERLDKKGLLKMIHSIMMEWHNFNGRNVDELETILMRNSFVCRIEGVRSGVSGMLWAKRGGEVS